MNTFKKLPALFILATLSSSAFAVANPSYEDVKAAIDNTLAKVEQTKSALDNNSSKDEVIDMITEARQLQKDIANSVLDLKRNQASNVLKQARSAVETGDREAAKESINNAVNRYKEIKKIYADNH